MFTSTLTRNAPAPIRYDNDADAGFRTAWNLSLEEWDTLTDSERRGLRDRVAFAPQFTEGK